MIKKQLIEKRRRQTIKSTPKPPCKWSRQNPSIEGYDCNYSLETEDGDRLSVDFKRNRRLARICLRRSSERGREYCSVIKSGRIIQERELSSRQSMDLNFILSRFSDYFATLPDVDLLKCLRGQYQIPLHSLNQTRGTQIEDALSTDYLRKIHFQNSLWRWFLSKRKENRYLEQKAKSYKERLYRRLSTECLDMLPALWLIWAGLRGSLLLELSAFLLLFLGILTGAVDWFWRQRSPFLPKLMFYTTSGIGMIFLLFQYRVWGMAT